MSERLVDPFGRTVDYLRLSVTDRCNYRCFYCIPAGEQRFDPRGELLDDAELVRLVGLFAGLGVAKLRLTGGEPLTRRGLAALAAALRALPGITDLSLSTNAALLAGHAAALGEAGVGRVNISLDSLDPATFARITGGGELATVLAGIDAALAAGLRPVKLNMVVMRGINDGEIEAMLDYAVAAGADLRFIETMPVGAAGALGAERFFPAAEILQRLRRHCGGELVPAAAGRGAGPARYYQVGGTVRLGVISAMSRHFCEGCNRVRLTARGELVLCLGRDDVVSLRDPLRAGAGDEELCETIRAAIARKPERHDFNGGGGEVRLRRMSALGG